MQEEAERSERRRREAAGESLKESELTIFHLDECRHFFLLFEESLSFFSDVLQQTEDSLSVAHALLVLQQLSEDEDAPSAASEAPVHWLVQESCTSKQQLDKLRSLTAGTSQPSSVLQDDSRDEAALEYFSQPLDPSSPSLTFSPFPPAPLPLLPNPRRHPASASDSLSGLTCSASLASSPPIPSLLHSEPSAQSAYGSRGTRPVWRRWRR